MWFGPHFVARFYARGQIPALDKAAILRYIELICEKEAFG